MQSEFAQQFSNDIDIDANADSDSLFGSPPPSPGGRGRSPSLPPLALPSGACSAQNVGTLALPGSHLVAELPVHPPASSLHTGLQSAVATRPSLPQNPPARFSTVPASAPTSASGVPRSLQAHRTRKGKERASASSRSSTPRPTPPPIELPSPDEPPPPNFLRNQQALLGLAGLVGGINPANLSTRVARGSSARNPIVINDTDTEPPANAGPLTSQPPSLARRPLAASTTLPQQLPPPTGEEVLATLVSQKNIFPVVESLLRLLAGSAQSAPLPPHLPTRTGWERVAPGSAPALKRRKLNKVPAGAADWDVPYPFQSGQGPADYQMTWARERARQLLADLVGLVQGAAKKAAVKAYYQQQDRERRRKWMERGGEIKIAGHYRPETAFYGLEGHRQTQQGSRSRSMSGTSTPIPSTSAQVGGSTRGAGELAEQRAGDAGQQSLVSFEDVMASFLGSTDQHQPGLSNTSAQEQATTSFSAHFTSPSPTLAESTPPFFNDWLTLLNAFPPGDPNDPNISPAYDDTLDAFASASASVPNSLFGDPTYTQSQASVRDTPSTNESIPDYLIDPALFALSPLPPSNQVSATLIAPAIRPEAEPSTGAPSTPTLTSIGSPLASTAELADPPTPDWAWAFGEPDVAGVFSEQGTAGVGSVGAFAMDFAKEFETACAPTVQAHSASRATDPSTTEKPHTEPLHSEGMPFVSSPVQTQASPYQTETQNNSQTLVPSRLSTPSLPQSQAAPTPRLQVQATSPFPSHLCVQTPSSAQTHMPVPQTNIFSSFPHIANAVSNFLTSSVPAGLCTAGYASPATAAPPSTAKEARARVLERARSLRGALQAAAERAKVELWETTVEQGVLVGLVKELDASVDGETAAQIGKEK
ncbi:hypothetical protein AcV5_008646 [Taiwanofungus camphoratus]|nr:hypothetical protein AcV5_008646 [Antrodia cinnamomea]KAI0956169.1 hypothetical protein AcV7_006638 [Antrodia cinnamomea]